MTSLRRMPARLRRAGRARPRRGDDPSGARAQGAGEAAATALFDDGRKLMAEHKYAEACPKLAESERLAPSGGTLINLADCYEHTGQTASAWVTWKDVAARANAATSKADVEKRALARAAALEPNLARLTVTIEGASDVPGLDLKRDGAAVGHAELGVALPVDPGPHVIEATAPKKKPPFSAKIDVAAKQSDARVAVVLEDEPEAVVAPLPVTPPPVETPATVAPPTSGGSSQKTVAVIVGVVGVGGLALGTVFGLDAKSKNDQALQPQNCRTSTLCTQTGLDLTHDAKSAATISTIAFAAGGAALAAGIILLVTAHPSSPRTGMRVLPIFTGSTTGMALDAVW